MIFFEKGQILALFTQCEMMRDAIRRYCGAFHGANILDSSYPMPSLPRNGTGVVLV